MTVGIIAVGFCVCLLVIALWLDLKDHRINSPKERTREDRYTTTKFTITK